MTVYQPGDGYIGDRTPNEMARVFATISGKPCPDEVRQAYANEIALQRAARAAGMTRSAFIQQAAK